MKHDVYSPSPGLARCSCGWNRSYCHLPVEMAVAKVDMAITEHKKKKGRRHLRVVA